MDVLGYAGWFDSHDGHSMVMLYVPWHLGTELETGYYLYFRSLTNLEIPLGPLAVHWLPALPEPGLFAAAAYDLGWWRGMQGRPLPDFSGTKGAAATALDGLALPLALLSHGLLLG